MTDGAGTLLGVAGYGAWGQPLASSLPSTPFGWKGQAGQFTDSETGNVYCHRRYYTPKLGRWLSRDPIGFAGGINLYGYCGGDPVNYADPSGLEGEGSGLQFSPPEETKIPKIQVPNPVGQVESGQQVRVGSQVGTQAVSRVGYLGRLGASGNVFILGAFAALEVATYKPGKPSGILTMISEHSHLGDFAGGLLYGGILEANAQPVVLASRPEKVQQQEAASSVCNLRRGPDDMFGLLNYIWTSPSGKEFDLLLNTQTNDAVLTIAEGHIMPHTGSWEDSKNTLGRRGLQQIINDLGGYFNVDTIHILPQERVGVHFFRGGTYKVR